MAEFVLGLITLAVAVLAFAIAGLRRDWWQKSALAGLSFVSAITAIIMFCRAGMVIFGALSLLLICLMSVIWLGASMIASMDRQPQDHEPPQNPDLSFLNRDQPASGGDDPPKPTMRERMNQPSARERLAKMKWTDAWISKRIRNP